MDAYKSPLVRIGCASIVLLCHEGTSVVCLFLVLNQILMNLYSLFLADMLLKRLLCGLVRIGQWLPHFSCCTAHVRIDVHAV